MSTRITFSLDPERDAVLIARLADLARTGDMSSTIRTALYAHLFPEQRNDISAVLDAIDALRDDLRSMLNCDRTETERKENLALGQALDEQLDKFFTE